MDSKKQPMTLTADELETVAGGTSRGFEEPIVGGAYLKFAPIKFAPIKFAPIKFEPLI